MVKQSNVRPALKRGEALVFEGVDEISGFAANEWKKIAQKTVNSRGRFAVALSGGSTPVSLYQRLAGCSELPWDKTHAFLVDERFVPVDHSDSTYRMVKATLLDHVSVPAGNVHPIPVEAVSAEAAAREYEGEMMRFFKPEPGQFPRFDLILLGIGEDGHTASLFPGASSLYENERPVMAVSSKDAKHERVTITFPVINNAENVIFLAVGKNKAEVVRSILVDKSGSLPAERVQPTTGRLLYLLDADSGVHLH
jgi:6-phosphogluconolactonase